MNDEENASGMVKIKGVWCGWHVAAARKDLILTYGNLERYIYTLTVGNPAFA